MKPSETPVHSGDSGDRPSAATAEPRRDLTGMVLGDFRVERRLGHGGMGEVYLAHQISLDRPIALKVLKPSLLTHPTSLARFEKEALNAARLNHPNIVHIYTFSSFGDLKSIAMEYVPGTNLRDYLAKKGPPAVTAALSIMRQAGQAIAAAGEAGLIHRDIKPENLLITRRGQVKVADFGLCRAPDRDDVQLTQQGVALGTPMYMSPEQVQGKSVDHRSDLYSLGVTFYHMLAGVPPHLADNAVALALKHVNAVPASLAVHRPDLPAELVGLVMKLMAKNPSDRYQSAGAMLKDLARIRESLHAPSGTVSLPEVTVPSLPGAPARSRWRLPRWRPSPPQLGRGTLLAVVAVAAVLGAAAGYHARSPDLLSARAPGPDGPPGLWLAPWADVPTRPTAEAQFRYALLVAPEGEREAAWLAVPGRFPGDLARATAAYTQLVRTLLRHGDRDRLASLSEALAASDRPTDRALAETARAGVSALDGDAGAVAARFRDTNFERLDPALLVLTYEVVLRAGGAGPDRGRSARPLKQIRDDLLDALHRPLLRLNLIDLG